MFEGSYAWYIFVLGLLSLISKTYLISHDSSHGYISNSDVYFNDFSFIDRGIGSGLRSHLLDNPIDLQIKFDPAILDFSQRPLGVPHIRKVHLFNFDVNKSVDMTSISGSTVHFHSSFFLHKKVPPMGNTSFNVVFLGREEGFMKSSLFIHTTNGHFKYDVKGVSVSSPYRLRPLVDIQVPVNSTFEPLIYLFNPHSEAIQISEVYTSGGEFHLELPTGEQEGPKKIWEIAPFERKAIIKVKFFAKVEQNHTAYIRIRLNNTKEILIVPFEIEISSNSKFFNPQGHLDFGIGGSLDLPKTVKLCVLNPSNQPAKIFSVTIISKAIKITYEHGKNVPSADKSNKCTEIANLTLDWKLAFKQKEFYGKIVINYKGKYESEIPYYLSVVEGGVSYNPQLTKYFVNDKSKNHTRHFVLKNNFKSKLKIINVTITEDFKKYFKLTNFKPVTLKREEKLKIFQIDLKKDVDLSSVKIDSYITLKTNISSVKIPIVSYRGVLTLKLPFKSKDYSLDIGLVGFNSRKEVLFLVYNKNPVDVQLKGLKSSIPLTTISVLGCGQGDIKAALFQVSYSHLHNCNHLKPEEYAIIELVIQTANNEGHVWGEILIETTYKNMSIPVQFKVASGKLEIGPDRLVFDQCFPGKICSHPIKVHSTFNEPMSINGIISLPPDVRLSSSCTGSIIPHATKIIGHLYLDPNLGCKNECYTGLHKDLYAQWIKTFQLPKSAVNFDLNLFNILRNRFLNLTSNGLKSWQNLTLRLDTSEVRGHTFQSRVKMSWPLLVTNPIRDDRSVDLPLTLVGHVAYFNVTIKNPTDNDLFVQAVLDQYYPSVELLYEGLPLSTLPPYISSSSSNNFFLRSNENENSYFNNMGIQVESSSLPLHLKSEESYTISVGFKSENVDSYSTLLLLRNNLTVLEIIRINARTVQPLFKFGNRKPGALQPLFFEFSEKYSEECYKEKANPNFSIKRSFTAKNLGEIPIFLNKFLINGFPCEGYGFKVLNCQPLKLLPNESRKIDIAFTPDFTLTKIERTLILNTDSNNLFNYTLQAVVPSYFINVCSHRIPRPPWETYVRITAVILVTGAIFAILTLAVIDSNKIKRAFIESTICSTPTVQPVLDLRQVGHQVRSEIQKNESNANIEKKGEFKSWKNVQTSDIYKQKIEVTKGPAVVPATSKSKKKLTKKLSTESSEMENTPNTNAKKVEQAKCNKSIIEKKDEKSNSPVNKESKKSSTKKLAKEETSPLNLNVNNSTENVIEHKDVEYKTSRVCKKNSKLDYSPTDLVKDNKINSVDSKIKLERRKSTSKNGKKDVLGENKISDSSNTKSNEHRKNNKPNKDQKDNLIKSKKVSEKVSLKSDAILSSSPKLWCENKATFSDVVARHDTPSTSARVINKPTMYVEPYQQTIRLGPIGSKPMDFWNRENNSSPPNVNHMYSQPAISNSSSFFTSPARNLDLEASAKNHHTNGWQKEPEENDKMFLPNQYYQSAANVFPNNSTFTDYSAIDFQDPWNRNLVESNAYWTGLNNVNINAQNSSTLRNGGTSIWGSSSVWEPWTPTELPKTPTRTPPGFNICPNVKSDEERQKIDDTYNPFASSNIWTQQQPNIWKYSNDL